MALLTQKSKSSALGQVFTPDYMADLMVKSLLSKRQTQPILLLDPCVGPGTFINSALRNGLVTPKDSLITIDIDPKMVYKTRASYPYSNLSVIGDDYLLKTEYAKWFDYIILNPPYIRQELISQKSKYRELFKKTYSLDVPGTANLYVYFIVKALKDLKPYGKFSCLVYDSWQSTKYGKWLKEFITDECGSVLIKSVHNQPFKGKLIDATIIEGVKKGINSSRGKGIKKSELYHNKSIFSNSDGFEKISNIFTTKRGLRLKQADFFLCRNNGFGETQFVKKTNLIKGFKVLSSHPERALLVTKDMTNQSKELLSEIDSRLKNALKQPKKNATILRWKKERPNDWFVHSPAPMAPIIFNYYLRNRPKHIYNPQAPYSDNFYGLNNLGKISAFAWMAVLNSTCVCVELLSHSRNQGGGLAKLQLFEYRDCFIPDLRRLSKKEITIFHNLGKLLISMPSKTREIIRDIDLAISQIFDSNEALNPNILDVKYRSIFLQAKKPKFSE